MSLAIVYTRASLGIDAPLVTVEVHLSRGLPGFSIVGLPETAVKESKERVRSAIINSQFDFPIRKIIVNLAPADLPKEGGRYDLPIALGILAASNQIPKKQLKTYEFAGELALSGQLRRIKGALPFALGTRQAKRNLMIPKHNATEAALPNDNPVFAATSLHSVYQHLTGQKCLTLFKNPDLNLSAANDPLIPQPDLKEVCGQPRAKRALEIAATGQHGLLMMGPPGTGKTMLATRLPSILPLLSNEETLEVVCHSFTE